MESLGTGAQRGRNRQKEAERGAKGQKGAGIGRKRLFPFLFPFPAIPSLVLSSLKPLLAP